MRIAFLDSYQLPYAVDQVDEVPLGGTHTVLCLLARTLADRGHEVTLVGYNVPDDERRGGVRHLRAMRVIEGEPLAADVAVVVNGAYARANLRRLVRPSVPVILWMQNDSGSSSARYLADPDERAELAHTVFVSRWQADAFTGAFDLAPDRLSVIPNALAPVFDDILPAGQSPLAGRDPDLLFYASAPNRGLEHFRRLWPALIARRPSLKLVLVGGHNLRQYSAADQDMLRGVYVDLAAQPNVRLLKSMGKRLFAMFLRRAAMMCYPVTFRETFCLLAVEALAAGCLVSAPAFGGLPEATAGAAGLMPLTRPDRRLPLTAFLEHTLAMLEARDRAPEDCERRLLQAAAAMRARYALPVVADAWERRLAATAGIDQGSAAALPTDRPPGDAAPTRPVELWQPPQSYQGAPAMWSDGYITDIEYTAHFFHVMGPAHLRFILAMKGVEVSTDGADFNYMELGSGQGLTSLVLAAAHPRARFFANDFNPAHIQRSRRLAAAAGLENVTFLETSFADLGDAGLPQMDFIVLHGIYSWVSPENQQAIVRFAGRHLKPGGMLYASYNVTPGWAPVEPLQRLVRMYAARLPGTSDQRMAGAVRFVEGLADAGAAFLKASPMLPATLERMKGKSSYTAHEYLNGHWELLTHAELAAQLGEAKLRFAASADATDLVERFVLAEPAARFLAGFDGDPLRETVKDYLRNNNFRRDIFVRGGVAMKAGAQARRLGTLSFALARPRGACALSVKFPVGTVQLAVAPHTAILDALAEGPRTMAELAALADAGNLGETARRMAALVAAGHVAPCAAGWAGAADPAAEQATRRLNQVMLDEGRDGAPFTVLASPVLGSGVSVAPLLQRLLLVPGTRLPEGPEARSRAEADAAAFGPLLRSLAIGAGG